MTFFRIFSEQENYFSCFFCVYIYYVLVDNMVSYRNKFYNVQTFQHSQFHELYIQTRIGIAFQPLILATNYKHIQTTTLALQTISNAAWIWYSSPIQFLQLNAYIQTKPKNKSCPSTLVRIVSFLMQWPRVSGLWTNG